MSNLPSLNGNWVDLIITIALVFYIWDGIKRGFFLSFLDLLSFILSFFIAVKFYTLTSVLLIANFNLPHGIANAVGFLLIGFLAEIIFSLLAHKALRYIPEAWMGTRLEKSFGILPAVGNTAIISAFILTLVVTLPVQGSIKSAIVTSKLGGGLISKTFGIEKQLNKIFGGAVEESLTFFTIKQGSQETVNLNFTQQQLAVDTLAEKEMFKLVNKERTNRGIKPLKLAAGKLQEVARLHARDMFQRGYFSHYNPEGESPFDRMEKAEVSFAAAGENLALAPSVILAHQGLMNSPGHRANILSPDFGTVGIGVVDGGIYGKMFVQEFTD